MAPCFSLCFDPHNLSKLPSFLLCLPFCRGLFRPSPSPLPSDDDGGAADGDDSHLNNHHVLILEIRQRAMMKARSRPRSSFIIVTAEDFGRLVNAAAVVAVAPPSKVNKSIDAEMREKNDGNYEGEEEHEEFFSVKSCFSRCSSGDEDCRLSGRTAALLVTLSEEGEGWPFGLWRRRKVVVLPPLPKSPADSWTWHKRKMNNVKV